MTLGEFLKKLRGESGAGIRVIAANTDIDQSTLCKYENGHRVPPLKHMVEFARVYGVDVKQLQKLALLDQICSLVINSGVDDNVLQVAEEHIEYTKAKIEVEKLSQKKKQKRKKKN